MNRLKDDCVPMEASKHNERDWAKHARVLFTSSLTSDVRVLLSYHLVTVSKLEDYLKLLTFGILS